MDLSVIVPCYNVADTLADQLDALADQEWEGRWEVIVVDNGSSDGTVEVAVQSPLGARLRVVSATAGQSVAYARNAGARSSTANAVAFCDGDDVVHPGWVAAMGDALAYKTLVCGDVDATSINEPWLAETRPGSRSSALPMFGSVAFARGNNAGMHRSLWEHVGGYDESFRGLEDIEFSLRCAAVGVRVEHVPNAIVDYRYREGVSALWHQGFFYGRGRVELSRRARQMGLRSPSPMGGLKSWIWLGSRIPSLATGRTARYAWLWVLANRIGSFRGALTRSQPFDFEAKQYTGACG